MGQITIGPLNIPLSLIFILFSALSGLTAVNVIYRKDKALRTFFLDSLSSAALIILGIWKLFPLVYNPELILTPLSLLYTPGGFPGIISGTAAGALYFAVKILKKKGYDRKSYLLITLSFTSGFLLSGSAMMLINNRLIGNTDKPAAYRFTAVDTQEKQITLDNFKEKTLILNFWATWCPPCRGELPVLIDFAGKIDSRNTVIIGVNATSTEKSGEAVLDFIRKKGINFPVIFDKDGSIAAGYGVKTLPTTVVISNEGFIIGRKSGTVDIYWLKSKLPDKNRTFK